MNPETDEASGNGPACSIEQTPAPAGENLRVEPMTGRLLLRLFTVPSVIVAAIVGCAVVVVLLFGAITTEADRSIDELLITLETSPGRRHTGGVLLPRDKEMWQVGLELLLRLNRKEAELTPDEVAEVATRLSKLLAVEPADSSGLAPEGRRRLHLLMHTLAATQDPQAVAAITRFVGADSAETRREALMALGRLIGVDGVRQALPAVVAALADPEPVVRTVACALLGTLACPDDQAAIDALAQAAHGDDREVNWNAAMSLARLGSSAGKVVQLDMLSRLYWEETVRYEVVDNGGRVARYPMPASTVDEYLIAAIDAASHLADGEVWEQISALSSDRSPAVAARAREALARRGGPKSATSG